MLVWSIKACATVNRFTTALMTKSGSCKCFLHAQKRAWVQTQFSIKKKKYDFSTALF